MGLSVFYNRVGVSANKKVRGGGSEVKPLNLTSRTMGHTKLSDPKLKEV